MLISFTIHNYCRGMAMNYTQVLYQDTIKFEDTIYKTISGRRKTDGLLSFGFSFLECGILRINCTLSTCYLCKYYAAYTQLLRHAVSTCALHGVYASATRHQPNNYAAVMRMLRGVYASSTRMLRSFYAIGIRRLQYYYASLHHDV